MTERTALITGGTGFIGSHTVVELLTAGYAIVIIDNLSNSTRTVLDHIRRITGPAADRVTFYDYDLLNAADVDAVFAAHRIDFVIHFAALKAVGESVAKPVEYYRNNLCGLLNLLDAMQRHGVDRIIFSSSATVYGNPTAVPVTEETPLQPPSNPYGQTKVMAERILADYARAHPAASVVLLRYFNPIGAHPSGLLGENPRGVPTNLMPVITQVLVGRLPQLRVFGDDYDTPDGTCVRDYIHVVDLARGHVLAVKRLFAGAGVETYNLGTGRGYSVLEIVRAVEKAAGRPVPYTVAARRPGDVPAIYADCSKAARELGFTAAFGIDAMCADSWRWQSAFPNGI